MSEASIIDGKALAADVKERVRQQVQTLAEEHGLTPGLAVVLVGEHQASQTYVRSKRKQTVELGMRSFEHNLPETTSEQELLRLIDQLDADPAVNGILVQLPLPDHISEETVLADIDPNKDVDGFHVLNTGRLWNGEDALAPCTPQGCVMLAKKARGQDLSGLHAVVVGRSNIVGKPVANLLLRENCTVTLAHSHTRDLSALCRSADILVAAIGQRETIRGDWIKPGATVIDVGITRLPPETPGKKAKLIGDVAFEEARQVAGAITPVPGGVGPMTIACLLQNGVTATCLQNGIKLA
jgi:methylenetetrahydrofolate dehydrogenase (NADP+)/methenyltetrahydrofolate cyclohydrolase